MNTKQVEIQIIDLAKDLGAYSLVITKNGKNKIEYGDTKETFNIASIRKCLLSALYGIAVERGIVNLSTILEQLGIDDNPPSLTPEEKLASINDLLTLRSGVYHFANYETASTKDNRPARGSHSHGSYWYYNNWYANVLGTIYKKLVGHDIFQDFKILIADRIGMEDFQIEKCEYKNPDENSIHSAYIFRISPRDLSKFIQLYLSNGICNEQQIVPMDWIKRSLQPYSVTPNGNGFGYMWEVATGGKLYGIELGNGAFSYSGYPGHYIVGVPQLNMTITYAHTLDLPGKETLSSEKFSQLLQLVKQL